MFNQCRNERREYRYRYHSEILLFHLRWSRTFKLAPAPQHRMWPSYPEPKVNDLGKSLVLCGTRIPPEAKNTFTLKTFNKKNQVR